MERVKKADKSSLRDLLSTKGTPLNKVCSSSTHPELNNNELNLTYEFLGSKGTHLNKVWRLTPHPELNNNDLISFLKKDPEQLGRVRKVEGSQVFPR